jgi:hypothetical protein
MASSMATKGHVMSDRDHTRPSCARSVCISAVEFWWWSRSQEEVRIGQSVGGDRGEEDGGGIKSFWEKVSSLSSSSVLRLFGVCGVVGVGGRSWG